MCLLQQQHQRRQQGPATELWDVCQRQAKRGNSPEAGGQQNKMIAELQLGASCLLEEI